LRNSRSSYGSVCLNLPQIVPASGFAEVHEEEQSAIVQEIRKKHQQTRQNLLD